MEDNIPKIEFPCDYPIKAIGENHVDLKSIVLDIVRVHAPDVDDSMVALNPSRNGTFVSVRFSIFASGEDQLKSIHQDLIASEHIKMVL
jgi:putative lipoic acid-binding regulatory protein